MEIIKNALVMPFLGSMDSGAGGVYDADKNFIRDSFISRMNGEYLAQPTRTERGAFIYGGCLFGHFGHFIWESLSRLATIRKCNNYPVLFLSPNHKIFKSQHMFFRNIGVHNELILIKDPTRVERLVYSSPQSSIEPLYLSDEQIKALACYDFSQFDNDDKIWLSRSQLADGKCGKITNEEMLEESLRQEGFRIVHPETLPLAEQVKLVSTSRMVAGFDGSQFFSALFARSIHGKFIVFNRRKLLAPTLPYAFDRKNIPYALFNFDVRLVAGDIYEANASYEAQEVDRIVSALREA